MTKQEKIKEAWGYFGGVVDDNGWRLIQSKFINEVKNIEISGCGKYYRPKSLQGIENNNGWIKIESENDLPKETDHYLVFNKFSNCIQVDYIDWDYESHIERWMEFNSHYQPIEKPKPPIY